MKLYSSSNPAVFADKYGVAASEQSALCVLGRQLGLSLVFKDRGLKSQRVDSQYRRTLMHIKAVPEVFANIWSHYKKRD